MASQARHVAACLRCVNALRSRQCLVAPSLRFRAIQPYASPPDWLGWSG